MVAGRIHRTSHTYSSANFAVTGSWLRSAVLKGVIATSSDLFIYRSDLLYRTAGLLVDRTEGMGFEPELLLCTRSPTASAIAQTQRLVQTLPFLKRPGLSLRPKTASGSPPRVFG